MEGPKETFDYSLQSKAKKKGTHSPLSLRAFVLSLGCGGGGGVVGARKNHQSWLGREGRRETSSLLLLSPPASPLTFPSFLWHWEEESTSTVRT